MKKLIILMLLTVSTTAIFAQTDNSSKPKKDRTSTAEVIHTCSIHPEVTSSKAGKCPKCGTELVVSRTGSKQLDKITYTCAMHTDVVSDTTGKCPVYGMTLIENKNSKSNSKNKM